MSRQSSSVLSSLCTIGLLCVVGCTHAVEDESDVFAAEAKSPLSVEGGTTVYGASHAGQYHLGPVEWHGELTNSCEPYAPAVEALEGQYLAGLDWRFNGGGELCDACIRISTATGKDLIARVVTNGQTKNLNDVDLSPAAFAALHSNEYPRAMTWQVVTCPNTGTIQYQYQSEANEWWTSLWVRNIRAPLAKVEVMSRKHSTWFSLRRETDGTYNDDRGFGAGAFTLRLTSSDGQVVSETFPAFTPGSVVPSVHQFR